MSTSATSLHFNAHGLDEAAEHFAPYLHVRYVQLERGPACFQGVVARSGNTVVGRCHGSLNKLERFDVPAGRVLVLLVSHGLARIGARGLHADEAVLVRGPQELVVFSDRECHASFAMLPDFDTPAALAPRVSPLPEAQARVVADVVAATLNDPNAVAVELAGLPHMLASCLRRADLPARAQSLVVARRNAAVRAREYIDRNLDRRLSLASVCRASYSSPRALEYGFKEVFGVSPMAYVRCSRLSCVRRELYMNDKMHGIVTQLAMKWGFWHLSQFSKDYFDLFGELPSATLNRGSPPQRLCKGLRKSDSRTQALAAF